MHLPQSNLNNAVGSADLVGLARKGILYGLGTASITNNMLEEARAALWAQPLSQNNPSIAFNEILDALFVNNRKTARRYWNDRIGEIDVGCKADLALIDYSPLTPPSMRNPSMATSI